MTSHRPQSILAVWAEVLIRNGDGITTMPLLIRKVHLQSEPHPSPYKLLRKLYTDLLSARRLCCQRLCLSSC